MRGGATLRDPTCGTRRSCRDAPHPALRATFSPPGGKGFDIWTNQRNLKEGMKRMSLKIRLSRGGAKKRPFYRIVVADARMPRDGRFVEKIGTFDPVKAKDDALASRARCREGQGLARQGRPADRPRAAPARRPRRRQARGAEQSAKGAAQEEGAGAQRRRGRRRREGRRRSAAATLLPLAGEGGPRSGSDEGFDVAQPSSGASRHLLPCTGAGIARSARLIPLGIFGAPHGVRGEVRVKSYTQEPRAIGAYGELTDRPAVRSSS